MNSSRASINVMGAGAVAFISSNVFQLAVEAGVPEHQLLAYFLDLLGGGQRGDPLHVGIGETREVKSCA